MTPGNLRDASADDLPRIVEIYNAAVPGRQATADTIPVSIASRQAWFDAHTPDRHPLWVLEQDGIIQAWIGLQPWSLRPAYHAFAEVSIYLAPEAQGRRLGTFLLEKMLEASPRLGIHALAALIFGHNEPSLTLFRRAGFELWGTFPGVADMGDAWRDLVILGRKV